MKYPTIDRGAVWIMLLLAFFVPLPAQTPVQTGGEDARKLLEAATADQSVPGSYKKISVTEERGITFTKHKYKMVKPDGVSLSRTESESRSRYFITYSTHIVNGEGNWLLRADNIAISSPSEGYGFDIPDEATQAKHREAMVRSLKLEHVTEKGVRYIKIVSVLSDADIEETRAFSAKVTGELSTGVSGSARRALRKMTADKTPGRIEHWLDETDHRLVRIRYLTKKGRLINEEKIDGVYERVPDLPEEMFVLPSEYKRMRPKTLKEFINLLYKYPANRVDLDPKKKTAEPPGP